MLTPSPIDNFDYRVPCDDFLLYQLAGLIEEDRASLEDDEFRRIIESGIHEHIERRLELRAEMAMRFRTSGAKPDRVLRAIEDIESPLADIPQLIESYASYLFQRLEQCSEDTPDETITAAADALLEFPSNRPEAEAALTALGSIRSAISARVLAYAISEPLLDEDLETKAYVYLRDMWPLPRPFMMYSLKPHAHEDIPFRWFQLLIECDEPSSVDRILEELLVHGGDADYREDLLALVQLLERSSDPERDEKILQMLNAENTPKAAVEMLEGFLKTSKPQKLQESKSPGPWASLQRAYMTNKRYLAAAKLFDSGKKAEAARSLEELLKDDPQYPFALTLRGVLGMPIDPTASRSLS